MANDTRALTEAEGKDDGAACRVASERTAWQYVTAMHAAAVGGARAPIRGIVEDVEDMRVRLTRERDEARARVVEFEKRLERRSSLVAALAHELAVRRSPQPPASARGGSGPPGRTSATAGGPRPGRRPSVPPA